MTDRLYLLYLIQLQKQSVQGNNAYVFPGIGLGVIATKARIIPDDFFLAAAKTLAELVKEDDINRGSLYPKLSEIRNLSLEIAVSVAEKAFEFDLARIDKHQDLRQLISDYMYDPQY